MANTHKRELFGFLSINNKRHPLHTGHNFIGRNKKANMVLRDISTSQQHALLTILGHKIYISDLRSSNHTYIGNNILTPLHLYEIEDQCVLRFGTVKATLIISNINQLEDHEALVESQVDESVFEIETQFQLEDNSECAFTPIQTIHGSSKGINEAIELKSTYRTDVAKSKNSQGLTQIFWETRKAFQQSESHLPYSMAIISNSDSDSDDDIVVLQPTQDLGVNKLNNLRNNDATISLKKSRNRKVEDSNVQKNDLNSEIPHTSGPSEVKTNERYTIMQRINSMDTVLYENVESIQKDNLENQAVDCQNNSQSSQPVRIKRKSTKQVLLSDSDTDLHDNDDANVDEQLHKITQELLIDNHSCAFNKTCARKPEIHSENIDSLPKADLDKRVVKSWGGDSTSQLFHLKNKANEQVLTAEVILEESAKVQVNDPSELIQDAEKSSKPVDSDDNDTDLDDNWYNHSHETPSKTSNDTTIMNLQGKKLSDENYESKKESVESDNNTDLDNDHSKPSQDCSQVMQIKRKSTRRVIESDSDTDLDDDNINSINCKAISDVKITETCTYSLESDAVSMEFDLSNAILTEDARERPESILDKAKKDKSNTQDDSNDIIVSSDEDIEALDKIALKVYNSKINNHPANANKCKRSRPNNKSNINITEDIFGVGETLHTDDEPSANESLDIKDTTQYITCIRRSGVSNETCDRNDDDDDLSFIPATQDVAENIEVSTAETEKLDSQEKACQASFSLAISDYIKHFQDEENLPNSNLINEVGKVTKEDSQNADLPEVDELGEDPELFLAATQQLVIGSCSQSNNSSPRVNDDNDEAIFFAPTQPINGNNDNVTNETVANLIFVKPKVYVVGPLDYNDEEIDADNSLFLAPLQQINPRDNGNNNASENDTDENSIFTKETQKIFTIEQEVGEKLIKETVDEFSKAEQNQKICALEQSNQSGPSTSKELISQTKCTSDNVKYLQKSENASILNDKTKTSLEENLGPSTSFKGIKVKRLSLLTNCTGDKTKYSQNSCKTSSKEHVENVIDVTIFEEPSQRLERNSNDIFDVPTQVVDHPDFQPLRIEMNNTNNDMFDVPTQELVQEIGKISVRTNFDLFDVPTQIISYDVDTKVLTDQLQTRSSDLELQTVAEIRNDDVTGGHDHIQVSKNDTVAEQQEVKVVVSVEEEVIREPEACTSTTPEVLQGSDNNTVGTDLDLFDVPTQIIFQDSETKLLKDNMDTRANEDFIEDILYNVPNQLINHNSIATQQEVKTSFSNEKEVIKNTATDATIDNEVHQEDIVIRKQEGSIATSLENELVTKASSSANSNATTSKNKTLNANNKKEPLEKLDNAVTCTPRVTRQRFKESTVNSSNKKLQKGSKKGNTRKKVNEPKVVEENIAEIKLAIFNTKDSINEEDQIVNEAVNDKPMFCTQEVLEVLTSNTPSLDIESHGNDQKFKIDDKIDLDLITKESTSTGRDDKNEQNDVIKAKDKKIFRGRKATTPIFDHKNKAQEVKEDLEVASEVLDAVQSEFISEKRGKSKSAFVKPNSGLGAKPTEKKTRKRKIQERKETSVQDLQPEKGCKRETLFSTQEVIDVLTSGSTAEKEVHKTNTAFMKPKDVVMFINIKTRKDTIKQNENENIKTGIFSTQEVLDVLTTNDVEEDNQLLQKNQQHVIEEPDSLSESAFMKDTKQLNANLQSTMLNLNDNDNESENDFEEIRRISSATSCSNFVNARKCVKGKSKKRVTIKDSDLDVMYEMPVKDAHSTTVQKPSMKHKFPPVIEDDDNDADAIGDSETPSPKTRRFDKPKSDSKTRSIKSKQIVGILKKPTQTRRTTRSKNDAIAVTVLETDTAVDIVEPINKKNKLRKARNNNDDVDNASRIEVITNVASSSTNNNSVKSALHGKRGRHKKSVDIEAESKDTAGMPPAKRVAGRKDTVSSLNSDTISDTTTLTPLSQRTKRLLKPKVVFTMLNSPELESVIRYLGGSVVDSVEACTVLVTASVKRTEKLLTAIGQGKPICSDKWLKQCKSENKFLDPWSHIFRDTEAETKWDFSLEDSLTRSQEKRLFQNYTMMLIVNTAQDILKKAIEATGGKCITSTRNIPKHFVIVSVVENKKKFQKYISCDSDVIIVEPEAIFDAVLRQEIRFDMFKIA